ncbi:phosphoribosylglycinamide formyltransferase-1 [Oceanospirillum multiglobuliferum]|uniref:Phosphoribosylglycinamide formyltransferase n=1 Tax=Oceanospirillum multiglobuliferum TaxID=64969 RepID=A0A1T4NB53_9GAMM|nr:phosphoribosylglycinamide formyltransferase [Oceanospirillum multiglobuliferum]OPX55906.1 phosphoribosylglycinamide formyltransferase [Oceanospirillum multiglobuliferum]SJZ76492.1 phosphoribosylglycinamide formyltransferase-1 [Oceanospirillum multiglobuliferum]
MTSSIVVLISGSGSNLQAIIDAVKAEEIPGEIRAVISNKAEAYGLERAKQAGIATEVLSHTDFSSRESFDQAMIRLINQYDPDLVVLAGFMRILSPAFVQYFEGRLLNIHPSLLPKFQGLHTHKRAIEAGEKEHGASVHFVTEELDGGPVFIQAAVELDKEDTPESLAAKVLKQEHLIYPIAVKWVLEGRIQLKGGVPYLDGISLANNIPKLSV